MRVLFLVAMMLSPIAASAGDTTLEPGAYEVEVRLDLPHIEDMGAQRTAKVCITDDDTHGIGVLSENNPFARCPPLNVKHSVGELSFDVVCEGHNQAVAHARFQLWSDRFSGVFELKMGGKNMTMTERQTGRRIGACQ